jgi:hypothetical protein
MYLGSSVSKVAGYWQDVWGMVPGRGRTFHHHVQIGPIGHPLSCPVGIKGCFHGR